MRKLLQYSLKILEIALWIAAVVFTFWNLNLYRITRVQARQIANYKAQYEQKQKEVSPDILTFHAQKKEIQALERKTQNFIEQRDRTLEYLLSLNAHSEVLRKLYALQPNRAIDGWQSIRFNEYQFQIPPEWNYKLIKFQGTQHWKERIQFYKNEELVASLFCPNKNFPYYLSRHIFQKVRLSSKGDLIEVYFVSNASTTDVSPPRRFDGAQYDTPHIYLLPYRVVPGPNERSPKVDDRNCQLQGYNSDMFNIFENIFASMTIL